MSTTSPTAIQATPAPAAPELAGYATEDLTYANYGIQATNAPLVAQATNAPLFGAITLAPYQTPKMSTLELGIIAVAIAITLILLCVLMTVVRR